MIFILWIVLGFSPNIYAQTHEQGNWIGELVLSKDQSLEVRVHHRLKNTKLPESEDWVSIDPPLKIKLLKENAMKEISAKQYKFPLGCDALATYKIETKEKIDPKEWLVAVPENKTAQWADASHGQAGSMPPFTTNDLADYHWERLYDKLAFQILAELPRENQASLRAAIRKGALKNAKAIRTGKFLSLVFADLSFQYKEKTYSLHRAFKNSQTGGVDEVPAAYASGYFYNESYIPNLPFYMNMTDKLNLILRKDGTMYRSVYFLTNFHGVIMDHNYSLGREDCD